MTQVFREFLKYALVPLVILGVLAVIMVIFKLFGFPNNGEILQYAKDLFAVHGYWIIFVAALAEGVLLANWYLPGSVVVVMGVSFAAQNGYSPVLTLGTIILGFFVTTLLNYFLGKYGWYKLLLKFGLGDSLDKAQEKLHRHGTKAILVSYIHPNLGALIATSAGILKMPFMKFLAYSVVALVVWNVFWGGVVYIWGPGIMDYLTYKNLIVILSTWIVVMMGMFLWKKRKVSLQLDNLTNQNE